MPRWILIVALAAVHILAWPLRASALERLCDTQFENCQTPLLDLISRERVRIDVAFWYMTDYRFVTALNQAKARGVAIRILVDDNAEASHPGNNARLAALRDAGHPMRYKTAPYILHFKMMLFHGLNTVQFSKANYDYYAFVPAIPNADYQDEVIMFTEEINITNSFRKAFDDLWVNTTSFQNYANVTENPLQRQYPEVTTIHSSMNFPPSQNFATRAIGRFNAEPQGIDAIVFRVTSDSMSNAILAARARQLPVRVLTEPDEYRNPGKFWHSKHIDKFWYAGVQIKHRRHAGVMHQASIVLRGLGEVIFGSSNWTDSSAYQQHEHNYFYNRNLTQTPGFFEWFAAQFDRKWNDTANYVPFQPLPPGSPAYVSPGNLSSGVSTTSVTLRWDGGTWAHLYDIYFGPNPSPPRIQSNLKLGSPAPGTLESFTVSNLLPGTTYYWRIVSKTWAYLENSGPVWYFTTAGAPPSGGSPPTTPFGDTAATIPGIVQVENFDVDGTSPAYYDTTAGNSGNVYRTNTNVDIGPTADANNNGHYVGWTRVGEWLEYTVNVTQTRTYQLVVRVANAGSGARFRFDVDGATGPVISVPATGGWDSWTFTTPITVSLTQGTHRVRLSMVTSNTGSAGVGNFGYLRFD